MTLSDFQGHVAYLLQPFCKALKMRVFCTVVQQLTRTLWKL